MIIYERKKGECTCGCKFVAQQTKKEITPSGDHIHKIIFKCIRCNKPTTMQKTRKYFHDEIFVPVPETSDSVQEEKTRLITLSGPKIEKPPNPKRDRANGR